MAATSIFALNCRGCERYECDNVGSSCHSIGEAKAAGWCEIKKDRRYEQSFDDDGDAIDEYEPGIWWTHLGVCPACSNPAKSQQVMF